MSLELGTELSHLSEADSPEESEMVLGQMCQQEEETRCASTKEKTQLEKN